MLGLLWSFFPKNLFCDSYEVKDNCYHELLLFVSGYYLPPMNCSTLLKWLLRPKGNTFLFNWWLLRPKGRKRLLSATSETADKKEETFEFSKLNGSCAWADFESGIFRELLISLFLRKENRSYLPFLFFLENVFSVYTTPLTRCAASSIHKMKTK